MADMREKLLRLLTYSQELGLDLRREGDRFKWFLASILFAKRISSQVAKRTYKEFEKQGIVTPDGIIQAGWHRLVEVLDSGGYVRYDFSTASNLLEIAASLREKYGSLEGLYTRAKDSKDLEKRLLEFKGVGPTAVNIFLRELRAVWEKAKPQLSPLATEVASRLGLGEEELEAPGVESALVRLNLEFCKGKRCSSCPVREGCGAGCSPDASGGCDKVERKDPFEKPQLKHRWQLAAQAKKGKLDGWALAAIIGGDEAEGETRC